MNVIRSNTGMCAAILLVVALLAGLPAVAQSGITPLQKCESGKNDAAGKYDACMAKAEKGQILKPDITKYEAAQLKCSDKYAESWSKLELAGGCSSTGDQASIQGFVDACVQSVAEALSFGGTLGPDPITCASDLDTCEAGLTSCSGDLAACVSSSPGFPETGQTTAYGTGSDGDLKSGTPRSFTDNGDGTITDNVTHLMWEKKDQSGGIHDQGTYYTWSTGTNNMGGTIVTSFLATLNGGGGFAGHTDWRIPNRDELLSLVNLQNFDPSIASAFNTSCVASCTVLTCSCTVSSSYWSSSTYQATPSYAWVVGFTVGDSAGFGKTNLTYIRAVRAGF